jgi:uncharacterized membrane protein YfhO
MVADFDPEREVILESSPSPPPVATGQRGSARIVESSTDEFTIEADVPAPSILVVTDGFDPGWRAEALAGSSQGSYQVLPANYILRAVPLGSGRHHLRLVYRAAGLGIGAWISCLTLFAFLALAAWCWVRERRGVAEDRPASGG